MKTAKNTTCAIALAIAATLAACSAEGEPMGGQPQPIDPTISVPLNITTALQSSVTASATRATTTPTPVPLKEGSIGVFLRKAGDFDYPEQKNIKYTGKDGVWKPANVNETLYLGPGKASITAYYPYNASNTDGRALLTTQDYNENALYYFVKPPITMSAFDTNGAIHFTMQQAYIRVRLHISYIDRSYGWNITHLGLYNDKLTLTGMPPFYYEPYSYVTTGNFILNNLPQTPLTVDTYTRDLLLVPFSLLGTSVVVKMTIDGRKLKATIPSNWLPRPGELYDINITVRGTEVQPVTVTTTDWEPVVVNAGNAYLPTP